MLNVPEHTKQLVDGIVTRLKTRSVSGSFKGGHGAALRVVALMRETVTKLPPKDIVAAYNEESGPAKRVARLWKDFGTRTIERMVEGCVCMADIWASAWKEGGGEDLPASALIEMNQGELAKLYRRADFFPSMSLALMVPLLTGGLQPVPTANKRTRRNAGTKRRAQPRRKAA